MTKIFCNQPFFYTEINHTGDVRVCCENWCNYYSLGNILETSFYDIIDGQKYKDFLKQFEEQDFKYCNLEICPLKINCTDGEFERYYIDHSKLTKKLLRLNFDCGCNLKCIFCRSEELKSEEKTVIKLIQKVKEILPYMNEHSWTISLDGSGEFFTSKHHIELIKEITSNYPNIRFLIITNGILASKEMIQKLGLEDRLECVEVSVHACTKKTYDKMVIGGNFDKVKENLEYLSSLKKTRKFDNFFMNFAVNSENYKEMEKFAKWAMKLGAIPGFLPLVKFGHVSPKTYEKLNIADENHPRYNDFVRILKKPIFSSKRINIPSGYLDLKPKKEKNFFHRLFRL